jgi:DNA sulfur modification protein DndD
MNNFRGFLGTHEIEFAHSNDESLTLILAENEVGKSTLLNSLMWCFYSNLTSESDRPSNIIHDDAGKKGAFVEVTLIDSNQEYLFKRTINTNDEITFRAWKINDIGEQEEKVNYPDILINTLLPKELSSYFLFDGEGLKDISVEPTELKNAIRNIMGLNAAEESISTIKKYIDQLKAYNRKTKESKKAAEKIK